MRVNNWISFGCIMAAIAIGVAIAVMLSDIATVNAAWCDARPACFRSWISSLSGWAAAGVALFSLIALFGQMNAARETLSTQRRTSEAHLRAYLGPAGAFLSGTAAGNAKVLLYTQNFGVTPAQHVSVQIAIAVFSEDIEDFSPSDATPKATLPDYMPGQSVTSEYAVPELTGWQQSVLGDLQVVVSGVINYRDAFGVFRYRNFVYKSHPHSSGPQDGPMMLSLHGNYGN